MKQLIALLAIVYCFSCTENQSGNDIECHAWETVEYTFTSANAYENPYVDVEFWVMLQGPDGYERKVWGFWDGGLHFKVRMLGTEPGIWSWKSFSNQSDDELNGKTGSFKIKSWTDKELAENPNRRGFIHATPSGRAWQYADGTPFYMLADTWWGAPTWRYPFLGDPIPVDYIPDSTNFSFEGGIMWLKKQGFNSIGLITALPNWSDNGGKNMYDSTGILIRSGKTPHDGQCMTMHSDNGHRAFQSPGKCDGANDICPDYDRLNPQYFKDLDKKMFFLNDNGMVPYVETVRRDAGPAWEAYHDWPRSFSRYINYIAARYGTMNMIYSLLHYDIVDLTIPAEKWKEAFDDWYNHYTDSKGMPFGQPTVLMGAYSTYEIFGHVTDSPWLQAHSVGNRPKDHTMMEKLETAMKLDPPIPGYCNEPYYVGWIENHVDGEKVEMNSDRDNYYARAHLYGHMMNGGLAGHIIGTGSRWCTGPGEAYTKSYPPPWETLHYDLVKNQAKHSVELLLSEGLKYQDLQVSNESLPDRIRNGFTPQKLEGWAHMLKTPDNELILIYFEKEAQRQTISALAVGRKYKSQWFNPQNGEWSKVGDGILITEEDGTLQMPVFPGGKASAMTDWVAKLTMLN